MSWVAAVAEATLRVSPVLVAVLVVDRLRVLAAPRLRRPTLLAGLLAALAMPVVVVLPVAWTVALPWTASAGVGSGTGAGSGGALLTWLRVAGWAWVAGTLLLLARLAWGLIGLHRLAAASAPLSDVPSRDGAQTARILVSREVGGPVTFGLCRPVIVLPHGARSWAPAQRRAVLEHEEAHIRHRDSWTLLMAEVAIALHWPNPLVWLVARAARTAAEDACDDAVLDRGIPPLAYVETLLALGLAARASRSPSAEFGGARGLDRRVGRLLGGTFRGRTRPGARPALVASVLALSTLAAVVHAVPADAGPRRTVSVTAQDEAAAFGIDPHLAVRIRDAAAREGIDYGLGLGLVSVESGFDASHVSASGALGLVQIHPETAASVAPGTPPWALLDPDVNLRVGFRLLGRHLARFSGDRQRALIAYNAGVRVAEDLDDGAADVPALQYARRVLQAAALARPGV